MRTLKRIIYVYDEIIFVKHHCFRLEITKDIKKNKDNEIYSLYDFEKKYEPLVCSTIRNYEGIVEIAAAYLTGDKQALEETKRKWCICY